MQTYPRTVIWRTDDLTDNAFELVYEVDPSDDGDSEQWWYRHEPIIIDDQIHLMTPQGVVMSEDDGRTWTEISTWR